MRVNRRCIFADLSTLFVDAVLQNLTWVPKTDFFPSSSLRVEGLVPNALLRPLWCQGQWTPRVDLMQDPRLGSV